MRSDKLIRSARMKNSKQKVEENKAIVDEEAHSVSSSTFMMYRGVSRGGLRTTRGGGESSNDTSGIGARSNTGGSSLLNVRTINRNIEIIEENLRKL